MTDQHSVHEGGRDYGAFIPSLIDDYGFDPYEYRIYCRLERRIGKGDAACFESIPNMASSCKMSRQKVRDALQVLVLAGIAKQEKQVGKTDRYTLMPPAHWVDSNHLDEIRQQVTAYRQQSDAKTVAKHNQLISAELRRSHLPNYDVVDTELRRSHLPNYDVVDTELRRSHLPNYDVVDTELRRSHKGSPIKVSNEGIQLRSTPLTPQQGNECVVKENLTSQPEEPGTGIQSTSLATVFNQPSSQLQPLTPHEEHYSAASLVGNKAMELERVGKNQVESLIGNKAMELGTVGKNQLERATQIAFRQNFDPARSQTDEAMSARATRESRSGDKYSASGAIQTKIALPETNPPAVLFHQPELSRVEPNNFGPDEHDAVLPTRKIAAIETSPTTPNPSQHQAPTRLQTELSFHPRSVANRVQETRFDRNQADLPKNLDGSDRLPWDTGKRGVFDQAFENHMARSLMQYPAYRDLMAGELITKVRKHISAGKYDLKRRDELLIEWEAMQNPAHNDFSTASSTLTAKGAARRAKIARALNMKDYL